jgi:hypothetical protein
MADFKEEVSKISDIENRTKPKTKQNHGIIS